MRHERVVRPKRTTSSRTRARGGRYCCGPSATSPGDCSACSFTKRFCDRMMASQPVPFRLRSGACRATCPSSRFRRAWGRRWTSSTERACSAATHQSAPRAAGQDQGGNAGNEAGAPGTGVPDDGTADQPGVADGERPDRVGKQPAGERARRRAAEEAPETGLQKAYQPASTGQPIGTLTPTNLVTRPAKLVPPAKVS
jgi:hypothetical protein